ncbi:ribosome maturation factor RimM [Intrasporangium sp. YIM S08009]|uniref:ribosome maturation factor RimM n=1 Tax=Intrasporangium zincisolvens TaxID=3080018 RepID=UPI002B0539FF|nr:ribosome maturation factor RimM [Intrasporangium sp. YIM S08009]
MNVVLARIGKPHGLRGEVTVQLHTDDPETRFAVGTVVGTEADPGSGVPRELTVASTRVHRGIWLIGFEEIPDRTGAEGLRGTRLVLPESQPQVEEDAYYEEDLVGLEVRDTTGARLGTVSGLEIGAAQDRLVLALDEGFTAWVPFVRRIVPTVAADHVVVDPPPGLFDLYREAGE